MEIPVTLFWFFVGVVFYHVALFPCMVFILSKLYRQPVQKDQITPAVDVIIPLRNEEDVVEKKAGNCLNQDYPHEKIRFLFASDGSTDRTNDILKACRDSRVVPLFFPALGKAQTINHAVREAQGDILVFSDASGMLNRSAIRNIVTSFADPQVGGVCGLYRIVSRESVDEYEQQYLDWEIALRRNLSTIYTSIGGHGGLYAVRRELFKELEPETINDDYIIPARAVIAGYRVVYEPQARIYDVIATDWKTELRRRTRISYGNWQQIFILRKLLSPRRPFVAWQFFSHKVLRAFLGIALPGIAVSSFFAQGAVYAGVRLLCLSGMLIAALGCFAKERKGMILFQKAFYLCLGVLGQVSGTVNFMFHRPIVW